MYRILIYPSLFHYCGVGEHPKRYIIFQNMHTFIVHVSTPKPFLNSQRKNCLEHIFSIWVFHSKPATFCPRCFAKCEVGLCKPGPRRGLISDLLLKPEMKPWLALLEENFQHNLQKKMITKKNCTFNRKIIFHNLLKFVFNPNSWSHFVKIPTQILELWSVFSETWKQIWVLPDLAPAKARTHHALRLALGIALCSSQRGRRLSTISNTLEEGPVDFRVGRATWFPTQLGECRVQRWTYLHD